MKARFLPVLFFLLAISTSTVAQEQDLSPWTNNPYGNEWIDYSKTYVRVGITANGMYKIPVGVLAAKIPGLTAQNVAAWFRGEQIALHIDGDNNVVFYGRKNDGVSDGLLFRSSPTGGPDENARLDKTTSFFSEEGAHFFSTSSTPERMAVVDGGTRPDAVVENFHTEVIVKNNSAWDANNYRVGRQFAFITFTSTNDLTHSFYQPVNAYVRRISADYRESLSLPNLFTGANSSLSLEYALHGMNNTPGIAVVSLSPDAENLYTPATQVGRHELLNYTIDRNWVSAKVNLPLDQHVSPSGNLILGFKPEDNRNQFGFSFYKISFSQALNMQGANSKLFQFETSESGNRSISISNAPSNPLVLDISEPGAPRYINNTQYTSGTVKFDLDKNSASALLVLIASPDNGVTQLTSVSPNIKAVSWGPLQSSTNHAVPFLTGQKINPEAFDYLIVTHKDAETGPVSEGAIEYADYRSEANGGSYRTLVISTRNIYDQFNYGEPSPVAIGRFVNYMISKGVRPRHHLFLIGHSVTYPLWIRKELPNEVPTFGDPGSDILLVANLSHSPYSNPNMPAIPVGRLQAFQKSHVKSYLDKVMYYEAETRAGASNPDALKWRRNILEVSGAKFNYELNQFGGYFNQSIARKVDEAPYNWIPYRITNSAQATSDSQEAALSSAPLGSYVNGGTGAVTEGVGAIMYFGHGAQTVTQYNIANVPTSDNPKKYFPFFYVTGCGVGNIFTSEDTFTIPGNWLIPSDRGAIVMVANSYKAYTSTAGNYIQELYAEFFGVPDLQRKTVGQAISNLVNVALNKYSGEYMIGHVNQTNVLGDPALYILGLSPENALPVELASFEGEYMENSRIDLKWSTANERDNDYFEIEKSLDGKQFNSIGRVPGKGFSETTSYYHFADQNPVSGLNYYRLKQQDKGKEFSYSNIISVKVSSREALTLFPNPAEDRIFLKTSATDRLSKWKVYSIAGNIIKEGVESDLDISSLSSGLYFIEVSTSKGSVTRASFVKK